MRHKPDVLVILAVSAFALTGAVAVAFMDGGPPRGIEPAPTDPVPAQLFTGSDGGAWFQSMRGYCNPVEVETRLQWQPAPPTPDGEMHKAACYALAGRIDQARAVIEGLPAERRYEAAGVVFEAGHPAADAGDDIAAGPLMELVVEYWPNHYMALYHAGSARFEMGDYVEAERYLERFREEYRADDRWTASAHSMLGRLRR